MKKDLPELKIPKNILGKISSTFIDRYKIVILIIIGVLIFGFVTYTQIPKESVPDLTLNYMIVQTPYPGASVTDIESMVSQPIEDKLNSVDDVKSISATIGSGYSVVIVELDSDADIDAAEQDVRNEIATISFPEGAYDPIIGVLDTGVMPIFQLSITGDYDLTELKAYGERVQNEMENINGIREVTLSGGYDRELQVIVDPVKLREYGLTISSISSALQASNINLPAGDVGINDEEVNIRVDERFTDISDIENLVIATSASRTIFLRDVAIIRDHYKDPSDISRLYMYEENAADDAVATPVIYLSAYRENGYDIVTAAEALRAVVDDAPGNLVPSDVEFIITADQSGDVEKDLNTVINNALGGLISVIIVLYIFIGLNEALIVSTVVPLSLFIALLLMNATGISLNTISLTGFIIALGLLVDNAIVVMENIDRLRDEGLDRVTASKAGINQVGPAILTATLTTIGAFIPVALLPGVIGEFMGVMPKTIIYILVASLGVSIMITPTLCAKFLTPYKARNDGKPKIKSKKSHFISMVFIFALSMFAFADQFTIRYRTVMIALVFTLIYAAKAYADVHSENGSYLDKYKAYIYNFIVSRKQKTIATVIIVAAFIASIASIPAGILDVELFPYEEPSSMKIAIEAPIGTMLDDTSDIASQIESSLYELEGVESFTTTVGADNTNTGTIIVELLDKDLRDASGEEIQETLREIVSKVPGASYEVTAQSMMSQVSSGKAVSLGLQGENYEEVKHYAQLYYDRLAEVEGIVEPSLSYDGGNRELVIDIDPNRAAYYGLSTVSIAQEIRQYISGSTVGTYVENNEEYDISIYYTEDYINSINDFDKIYFTSATGNKINFSEVADIKYVDGVGTIEKEEGKFIVYVEADLLPGYNATEVNQTFNDSVSDIKLPTSIDQKVGGQMQDLNEQIYNMAVSFSVALLLVYLVLVVQFNSLIQPVMILISVPFALIGVVVGLIVTGNNLGFYAMFGIVALVGIAVNDAIVLIDYANFLRREGMPLREATAEAVKTRFQSVLTTSLTTIGGMLPLAMFNDTFSQLGYALIFGLVASTVLTLLIIPMIYYTLENKFEKRAQNKEMKKLNNSSSDKEDTQHAE